ncbi:hypothetical protein BKA83DRAFT_7804 [Pisolithus microcarpus]|nr:hypothetical protein BKA83DRAFT_7804 [Pisolithus microcarpus]
MAQQQKNLVPSQTTCKLSPDEQVHIHCYEAVDLDAFIQLTNKFKFPIATFHHAHEAYLIPELLKKAYNHTPAVAMFGSFARFKREGYRHSTYAPHILHNAVWATLLARVQRGKGGKL